MPEISSASFSETDASNNSASPNGFPESMAPSGVNDSARAVMGALKRFWDRIQGAFASTGSSNAYVLTPTVALAAYVTGERYSFRANFANTGAATLNISALGAKTIKKFSAGASADLAANDIVSGLPVTVEYDGTNMVMVTPVANSAGAASTTAAGLLEIATAAEYRAGNATDLALTSAKVWDAMAEVTLTDAATVAWDMSLGFDFILTAAGNRTLGNPTNVTVGKKGRIYFVHSGAARTLTKSSNIKTPGGAITLSTTGAGVVDVLYYDARSATEILVTVSLAFS